MATNAQTYQWSGINHQGARVRGVVEATDMKDAQFELKKMGIEVISLEQKSIVSFSKFNIFSRRKKIKQKDILLFTRYLSTMLTAGLPIVQALDIISQDQENSTLQAMIIKIRGNIAEGKTLAESFAQHPQHFSDLYSNLVKAGEKSGTLDKILNRLANYLEKTENLKRKVKKALIYPIAIMSVALIVSLILLIFVVPQFQKMFASFGAQLPWFTRQIVNLSDFVQNYWWLLIIGIVGGIWWLRYSLRHYESVKQKIDQWSLKLYIIGPVLRKSIIARFTRTMATTLEAGMPIVESMKAMAHIMGNRVYSKAIMKMADDVVSGHQLSAAMNNTHLFPNMAIQMISVGEASGKMADMLNKVADYYEDEVNAIVDNLSSLLEPLIMLVLGVVVGSFVIAMYLPIFKMGSLF